jgi:C-terminal processing protease CtpA/Prc
MNTGHAWTRTVGLALVCISFATLAWTQKITSFERQRAQEMLTIIAADVKKHYYDPKFHGVDWDSKVREVKQKIDQADRSNKALSEIAALLDTLNDSHTFFLPPQHSYRHDYGWQAQSIGNRCYVIRVRPGSDAEQKGVKPGDELLSLDGYNPSKENFWKMEYYFNTLSPQGSLRLELRDPTGRDRTVDAVTKITETRRVKDLTGASGGNDIWELFRENEDEAHHSRARTLEIGDELMILKFPGFFFNEGEVDTMINKARKHKTLILDLRDNGGGSVDTLKFLLGRMFDKEIKIGDRVGRDEHKPMVAKPRGNRFEGKLIVLQDSHSASASEIFARVVQIEKRGIVLGDVSSGKVMEAKRYSYQVGMETVAFYGASITDADIIMADGKSLENTGVTPDEVVLPNAADLANDRDPVMAHAAGMAGVKLSPEAAGKLFPYEWQRE